MSREYNLLRKVVPELYGLPDAAGVFALCDLDCRPIYVEQVTGKQGDTIRGRVRRMFTSSFGKLGANRQIDAWEVAYLWGWEVADPAARTLLEAQLFHLFDGERQLVNGTVPPVPAKLLAERPDPVEVQILPSAAIEARRDPAVRFPRQVQQFHQLLDYILNTQDKAHLRRALDVHHQRLKRHLDQFLRTHQPLIEDDADGG